MVFRTLILLLILMASITVSFARGPAVEDFVGIEVDHPEQTPQGTEGLFNFEKDIQKFEIKTTSPAISKAKMGVAYGEPKPVNWFTITAILVVLGLPFVTWMLVMNR